MFTVRAEIFAMCRKILVTDYKYSIYLTEVTFWDLYKNLANVFKLFFEITRQNGNIIFMNNKR